MAKQTIRTAIILTLCTIITLPALCQHGDTIYKHADTVIDKKDIIDFIRPILKKNKEEAAARRDSGISNKKIQFTFVPSGTSVPGGGAALVTSTNMSFYLGDRKKTSLSVISFTPYTNFSGRYVFPVKSNIWLDNNKWNLVGDLRYLIYPQNSWGLGGNSSEDQETLIDYQFFRFYESVLRRIIPNVYAGAGINVDHHFSIKAGDNSKFYESIKPYYDSLQSNTISTGINFTFQYDSRKNTINPEDGLLASVNYRINPSFMPNTSKWSQLYVDVRRYISFSKQQHNLLAFWGYYWAVLNGDVPYLDLPNTGWEPRGTSARGIYQSRYRSDKQIYFETEYRRDITRNGLLGFVVFSNISAVSEFHTLQFNYWHPAVGTGLRLKFNKFSNTNIDFDVAASKDLVNFYINIGEVF
jgi:hypothetical protein